MNNIKISIIVPIYNVEQYLEECLESLVHQTINGFEIIAVNDGSTDSSNIILDKYQKKYPTIIKAFHKENGGLSDARNFGIDQAIGEYIGFVDSDDWVDIDMFKEMYKKASSIQDTIIWNRKPYLIDDFELKLSNFNINTKIKINLNHKYHWITETILQERIVKSTMYSDIVMCGGMKHIISDKGITLRPIKIRGKRTDCGHSIADKPNLLFAGHSLACNKIFARHLFENKEYRFPLGQWFEDSALIYTLLFEANKISCVHEPFYHYRFNRVGAITSQVSPKIFDIFKSCDVILENYNKHRFSILNLEPVIEKIVRSHLIVRIDTLIEKSTKENKKLALAYSKQAFDYLDKHFHGWRERYSPPLNKKFTLAWYARKHLSLVYLNLFLPSFMKKFLDIPRKITRIPQKIESIKYHKEKRKKQRNLQKHGFDTLATLDDIFKSLSIKYFVDFGTLLGFVREQGFMAHDLDLDLGAFATEEEKLNLHAALQAFGYKLFRTYILNDKIVEQSYHYVKNGEILVKFDINFYENNENYSKTWLFYYLATFKLKARYRHVVEMKYSKITDISSLKVQGYDIPVPKNYKKLLEEKYGKTWNIPDSDWIYWKSPAATPLEEKGYYITKYNFPKSKIRELQLEQLKILNTIEEICNKHGFRYYLAEGTLLGAVRHQGYIPWDDDIDISMPREDYESLLTLLKSESPSNILLWDDSTDENYHLPFAKVVSTESTNFRNTFPIDIKKKFSGPRIDIFPLDSIHSLKSKKYIVYAKKMRTLRTMMLIKAGYSVRKTKKNKFLSLPVKFIKMQTLQQQIRKIAMKENSKSNNFILNWFSAYGHIKQTMHKDAYSEPMMIEFENKLRPVPKEFDYALKKIYGEYMIFPPVSKRSSASHFMIFDGKNHLSTPYS